MELHQLTYIKHLFRFNRNVYLDHNATTPISKPVLRIMKTVLNKSFGNPSSSYALGRNAADILETARQRVADAIHAKPSEIYFTGSATESNNAVIMSIKSQFSHHKNKIISTPIEHPSVVNTLAFLQSHGFVVEYCPVDKWGRVILSKLEGLIDDKTFLVCSMLANNEIGTIQDIPAICNIAHNHNVLVLSDCVQALGKIPVNVQELGIDYATFSAHKVYGPKGVGALYVKSGSPFTPLLHGGHQESGMRAGTEGIHNIAGFGVACQNINGLISHSDKLHALKKHFLEQLSKIKPDCLVNSPKSNCLENTISVTLPNVNNTGLVAILDYHGIAVSTGSACNTFDVKPSHVLKAIGLSDQQSHETIRFSFGYATTRNDISYTVKTIRNYLEGKTQNIPMIEPSQLTESILFDEQTYILDVRPQFIRNNFADLPNSHEISFASVEKYLHQLPKDKHIIVVCQRGHLAYMTSHYLKAKGFLNISCLRGGACGWKKSHADLYEQYAGKNCTVLRQDFSKKP